MPRDRGRPAVTVHRCAGDLGGALCDAGPPGLHPLGQRAEIHRGTHTAVARGPTIWRANDEPSSLIRTGTTTGGRSLEVYLGNLQNTTLTYGPVVTIELESGIQAGGFGTSLAVGNIDFDGRDELAIGAPGGGKGKNATPGKVFIYKYDGTTTFDLLQELDSSSMGLAANDGFGSSVAFGDVEGGDGFVDLIVGASGRDVFGVRDAGEVFVFSGSSFTAVLTLTFGTNKNDLLGTAVATAPNAFSGGH